jgi:hypothetical protein
LSHPPEFVFDWPAPVFFMLLPCCTRFLARHWAWPGAAMLVVMASSPWTAPSAQAQVQTQNKVYSCVAANGRRLTSDRPIPECNDREQRVLGRDGTVLAIVQPSMTAEERAAKEATEQRVAAERAAQAELARMDRNLQRRYPNEAAHSKARAAALGDVQAAIERSKKRLAVLAEERKPLEVESEFYTARTLPLALKRQIDANDAARQAVLDSQANNQTELERVTANYDKELERLRKLWSGASPGHLGVLALADKPAPAKKPAAPVAGNGAKSPAPAASAASAAASGPPVKR